MQEKVIILMSVYNGKKYIKEQLDSIFDQSYKGHITALIRDDGSKDGTAELIKACRTSPEREVKLIRGKNIGPQRSFLRLIRKAGEADCYFFADQDDVWDKDKIELCMDKIRGVKGPAVYCSNYRLSDMDLNIIKEKGIEGKREFTPLKVLFYNWIPGCTMGMNHELIALLKKLRLKNVMMHDSMALCLAAYAGEIIYDEEPRITHRIHGDNVVGEGHKKIFLPKWIKEKFTLLLKKEDYDLSQMAEQFISIAEKECHREYLDDMRLLCNYKKSRSLTRKLLKHPDLQGEPWDRTTLSIRSKVRFHLF